MPIRENKHPNAKIIRIYTDPGYPHPVRIDCKDFDLPEEFAGLQDHGLPGIKIYFVPLEYLRDLILRSESENLIDSVFSLTVRNDYQHLFFPMPTESHLEALYDQMKALVAQGLKTAEESGKKLLLIAGEEHYSKGALLLQALLIHIANEAKMRYLLLERTERQLQRLITPSRNDITLSKNDEFFSGDDAHPNMEYTAKKAEKLGMYLIAADLEVPLSGLLGSRGPTEQGHRDRESHMATKALALNEHAFFILGAAHIKGLQDNSTLQTKFHLVALNVMCIQREFFEYNLRQKGSGECFENVARIVHAMSDQVVQINMDGNPSMQPCVKILEIASAIYDRKKQQSCISACAIRSVTQFENSASTAGMFYVSHRDSVTTDQASTTSSQNNFCGFQFGFLIGKRF